VLASAAPTLANFFKEMKMSILRVRGTLATLVLFATVAVFPSLAVLASKKTSHKPTACEFRNTGVLVADGGDPWPPPPSPIPLPWLAV